MKTKNERLLRRVIGLLSFVWFLLAFPAEAKKLKVVTTLSDFASLAQTIGRDRVDADSIAKGYQDPHFVEPKPSFVLKLHDADVLIVAGLELEIGYLPPLLDQARNEKIRPTGLGYLDASVGCDILDKPAGQVTRAMGDVHPYGNPHYWLDPSNGRVIARAIAAKLTALDPAGAADYARNLADFEAKLKAAEIRWAARLAPFKNTKIVTYHSSWPNFAKAFSLDVVGFLEPKPGIPPSPQHKLEIINLMREQKVPLILMEVYFDKKDPDFVASKTGATVVVIPPSVGGEPAAKDYLSLFDVDVEKIVSALEKSALEKRK
ncbi:MAG: metal ABC transporter substrate-binding protein [Acidobacteriota bacterium]|nr:metal ABC transporter substrate-binding protein [Acidobacteriota bacterium]